MKKIFISFLFIVVIFFTGFNAYAAKNFEIVGTITGIEYMRIERDCLTGLCFLVDVGGGEIWPVQPPGPLYYQDKYLIMNHADWTLDAFNVVLQVSLKPTFNVEIVGWQKGTKEDVTPLSWPFSNTSDEDDDEPTNISPYFEED